MPERWLPIGGYEGLYEVSDLGRVRGVDRIDGNGHNRRGRVLRLQSNGRGARKVSLCRDGVVEQCLVHALVLTAFDKACPPGMEGLHGPAGRGDDSLTNLRWGTSAENKADMVRDGTSFHGERNPAAKLTRQIVVECRRRHANGETQRSLAAEFGVTFQAMSSAIIGKNWRRGAPEGVPRRQFLPRSEEHTAELQALRHPVC